MLQHFARQHASTEMTCYVMRVISAAIVSFRRKERYGDGEARKRLQSSYLFHASTEEPSMAHDSLASQNLVAARLQTILEKFTLDFMISL